MFGNARSPRRIDRFAVSFGLGLAGVVWFVAAWGIPRRGIDPDELEHLHAAFCVFEGALPYRDFFEHHAPALYWCAQPAFWIAGPSLGALWLLRGAMWLVSAATAILVFRIGRRLDLKEFAALATVFLVGSTVFFSKGIEFRPDVPAVFLLTVVLHSLVGRPADSARLPSNGNDVTPNRIDQRNFRLVLISVAAGGATLFTQKAIVPLAAFAAAITIWEWRRSRRWRPPAAACAVPLGVAVVWGIVSLGFAWVGSGEVFLESTVAQLVRWSVRSATWQHLRPTLVADGMLWGFALLACVDTTLFRGVNRAQGIARAEQAESFRPESRDSVSFAHDRVVILLALALCMVSLAFVKATFPQYYLLWFPLLALAAGIGFRDWLRLASGGFRIAIDAALCAGVVLQTLLLARGWLAADAGPFSQIVAHASSNAWFVFLTAWGFFAVGCGFWLTSIKARGLAIVCLLGMGYATARNVDSLYWSNDDQVTAVNQLQELVPEGETVLDGFTGLGVLRPHAYYMWWLNEFSLGLISGDRLERELNTLFDSTPPSGVLYDENLQRLPQSIRRRIENEYVPSSLSPLRIRRNVSSGRRNGTAEQNSRAR